MKLCVGEHDDGAAACISEAEVDEFMSMLREALDEVLASLPTH